MEKIERGRLVWVTNLVDPQGNCVPDHRGVILTTNADYKAGKPIRVAIISSKFNHDDDGIVKLDGLNLNRPGGHPQTGLTKPSAIICKWSPFIAEDQIISYEKTIWGTVLEELMQKVPPA